MHAKFKVKVDANRAALDLVFKRVAYIRKAVGEIDHQIPARLFCRLQHSLGLAHGARHRLLAQNMQAASNRFNGHRCVQFVWQRHADAVEVGLFEHRIDVRVCPFDA